MKRITLLLAALLLASCGMTAPAGADNDDVVLVSGNTLSSVITVWHDNRRYVTCWNSGHGIACMTDTEIRMKGGQP